jgi:hypothetical protein
MSDERNSRSTPSGALITPKEASRFLRNSVATLATWRSRGRIARDGFPGPPFYRVGRSIRYRVGDLIEWAQRSGPHLNTGQKGGGGP